MKTINLQWVHEELATAKNAIDKLADKRIMRPGVKPELRAQSARIGAVISAIATELDQPPEHYSKRHAGNLARMARDVVAGAAIAVTLITGADETATAVHNVGSAIATAIQENSMTKPEIEGAWDLGVEKARTDQQRTGLIAILQSTSKPEEQRLVTVLGFVSQAGMEVVSDLGDPHEAVLRELLASTTAPDAIDINDGGEIERTRRALIDELG